MVFGDRHRSSFVFFINLRVYRAFCRFRRTTSRWYRDRRRYSRGRTIEILVGRKEEVGGLVVSDLSLPRKESYPQVEEQSGEAAGTAEERPEEDRGTRLRQAR